MTINAYLIDRDIYRVKRGQDEKWQEAHLGLIEGGCMEDPQA